MGTTDAVVRQWVILQKLPRYPQTISTTEMYRFVKAEGYDVVPRTIQRDLESLSTHFAIISEEHGKSYYWSWTEDAPILQLPGIDPMTGLAFQLAESYLTPILPNATLKHLTPYFKNAEIALSSNTQLKQWADKVAVIERGPTLIKPEIDNAIQNAVYQALMEGKQLKAGYEPRSKNRVVTYTVHPLAVVSRQGVIYLVCTLWNYEDIRQLALHRFVSVEILDKPARSQPGFNLSDYIEQSHQFAFPLQSEPIGLKLLFKPDSVFHLYETPLTENQQLSKQDDGRVLLEAWLRDTMELRWWINSFGSEVEVLAPVEMRDFFINQAKKWTQYYL